MNQIYTFTNEQLIITAMIFTALLAGLIFIFYTIGRKHGITAPKKSHAHLIFCKKCDAPFISDAEIKFSNSNICPKCGFENGIKLRITDEEINASFARTMEKLKTNPEYQRLKGITDEYMSEAFRNLNRTPQPATLPEEDSPPETLPEEDTLPATAPEENE